MHYILLPLTAKFIAEAESDCSTYVMTSDKQANAALAAMCRQCKDIKCVHAI